MGMTMTEKILAGHSGKDTVRPGELIDVRLDVIMCHDVTAPAAITMLAEKGMDQVFDAGFQRIIRFRQCQLG